MQGSLRLYRRKPDLPCLHGSLGSNTSLNNSALAWKPFIMRPYATSFKHHCRVQYTTDIGDKSYGAVPNVLIS